MLRLLAEIAENEPEKYAAFWKEFGAVLKEGVAEDYANRDGDRRAAAVHLDHVGRGRAGRLAGRLRGRG